MTLEAACWWLLYAVAGLLFAWPATVTTVVMCRWWACSRKGSWNAEGAAGAVAKGLSLYRCPRCHRWHEGLVQE